MKHIFTEVGQSVINIILGIVSISAFLMILDLFSY